MTDTSYGSASGAGSAGADAAVVSATDDSGGVASVVESDGDARAGVGFDVDVVADCVEGALVRVVEATDAVTLEGVDSLLSGAAPEPQASSVVQTSASGAHSQRRCNGFTVFSQGQTGSQPSG